MDRDKLARMASTVRTGGKGTVRRKKKAVHKATSTDDKRLQGTLKRLGVNNIPGIEEVNLFQTDGNVIHFNQPKVQASISANTYVVSGSSQTQSIKELLPGIMNQIGTDFSQIQKMVTESLRSNDLNKLKSGTEDDDNDVPDLVDNFEEASK